MDKIVKIGIDSFNALDIALNQADTIVYNQNHEIVLDGKALIKYIKN